MHCTTAAPSANVVCAGKQAERRCRVSDCTTNASGLGLVCQSSEKIQGRQAKSKLGHHRHQLPVSSHAAKAHPSPNMLAHDLGSAGTDVGPAYACNQGQTQTADKYFHSIS